jgi:hypothetical protein
LPKLSDHRALINLTAVLLFCFQCGSVVGLQSPCRCHIHAWGPLGCNGAGRSAAWSAWWLAAHFRVGILWCAWGLLHPPCLCISAHGLMAPCSLGHCVCGYLAGWGCCGVCTWNGCATRGLPSGRSPPGFDQTWLHVHWSSWVLYRGYAHIWPCSTHSCSHHHPWLPIGC